MTLCIVNCVLVTMDAPILCRCIKANNRSMMDNVTRVLHAAHLWSCRQPIISLENSVSLPLWNYFLLYNWILPYSISIHFCISVPHTSLVYSNFGEKLFNWMAISYGDDGVSHHQLGKTHRGYYKVMRLT